MKLEINRTLAGYMVLGGLVGCFLARSAAAQSSSSTAVRYATDAKEARAMTAQIEHRKTIISYAVVDFEKSLYNVNVADCERKLDKSPVLSVNGVRMNTCEEVIAQRRSEKGAHQKLKLRNEIVDITDADPCASVTVVVFPGDEHDSLILRQIGERWLVTSFTSTRIQ